MYLHKKTSPNTILLPQIIKMLPKKLLVSGESNCSRRLNFQVDLRKVSYTVAFYLIKNIFLILILFLEKNLR